MLDIVTYGDEILARKAEPIKDIDDRVRSLAEDMFAAMAGRGIGLAGPQVAVSERIFVTNVEGDKPRVFINPEIVLTSQEIVSIEEGCLSLPRLFLEIVRPEFVRVQAWNERGRPFTVEIGGLLARVILHEYDHLEGILFVDRLKAVKKERAISRYQRLVKA